jgi:proteasome lid subunit RPN8/RPN11
MTDSGKHRIRLGQAAAVAPGRAVIEEPFPEARAVVWRPRTAGRAPATAFVVTQEVFRGVNRHVSRTLERELGGFLLGNRYRCPNTGREYVVVDQYSEAKFTESNEVRLSFTLDAWSHLGDELSGKFYGKLLVGWYHSHPRMDVFLSAFDVAIHEDRFAEPWMTALVIEPEARRGGFFCWHDGRVNPRDPVEFYELFGRRADASVVDWSNHTSDDPRAARRARSGTFTLSGPTTAPLALPGAQETEPTAAQVAPSQAAPPQVAPSQVAPSQAAREQGRAAAGWRAPRVLVAAGAVAAIGVAVAAVERDRLLSGLGLAPASYSSTPAPGPLVEPPTPPAARPAVRRATATLASGEIEIALTVDGAPARPAVTVNGVPVAAVSVEAPGRISAAAPAAGVAPGDVLEVSVLDAGEPAYASAPVLVAVGAPREAPAAPAAAPRRPGDPSDPLFAGGSR